MTALAVSPGGKARVLIAADHLATRTGLRLALGEAADCSEADDAATAIATAIRVQPDVCVVDFDPPGRAIRAVAEITSKVPGSSVVVMTRRIDEEEFIAAVSAVHGKLGVRSRAELLRLLASNETEVAR